MAKLKCDAHKRRVVVADGKFTHRSDIGDGTRTRCDSPTATINGKTYSAKSEHFHAS